MSYQGYEQHICWNGHRFDTGASYAWGADDGPKCPVTGCDAHSEFCNSVDQTNTRGDGKIEDWSSLLISPAKTETCSCCKHTEFIEEAKYRIPTKKECSKL